MVDNLRPIVPSLANREAVAGCFSELTRTNSDSSAVDFDGSKDFSNHSANAKASPSAVWTDEKHRLYLDSLEASFVNQLHHFIGLHGCLPRIAGRCPSQELLADGHNSKQFMVLRDGCWQKINFERNDTLTECTADSHFIRRSRRTCHFTSAGKQHPVSSDIQEPRAPHSNGVRVGGKSTFPRESARHSEQHPVCGPCHLDLVGSTLEVSDQNFVDEDQGQKSRYVSMSKRLKTVDVSRNGQVVPLGKTVHASTAGKACFERERQLHQALLSENLDNFVSPKSDLHYFLRGS